MTIIGDLAYNDPSKIKARIDFWLQQKSNLNQQLQYDMRNTGRANPSTNRDLMRASNRVAILEYDRLMLHRRRIAWERLKDDDRFDDIAKMTLQLVIRDRRNVFLSGSAGTGKSYLLRTIREELANIVDIGQDDTRLSSLSIGVCAPTGTASVTVQGITMHRFFGLMVNDRPCKAIRDVSTYSTVIVDEISMVGCKQMDEIFSGSMRPYVDEIQWIMVGDFLQLPPISDNFAFISPHWEKLELVPCVLKKIHRQNNIDLIRCLNSIRNCIYDDECREILAPCSKDLTDLDEYTHILATNAEVDARNNRELSRIDSVLVAANSVDKVFRLDESPDGIMTQTEIPMTKELANHVYWKECQAKGLVNFKCGAKVMFVRNMLIGEVKVCNGTLGTIIKVFKSCLEVEVDGFNLMVFKQDFTFLLNEFNENGLLKRKLIMSRKQYPFIIAYAITAHKAQSKSLSKVVVDGSMFRVGALYVALSRVTSLEGLRIINFDAIKIPYNKPVLDFYASL